MLALLILIALLSLAAIVATVLTVARDGYGRAPTRESAAHPDARPIR